MCIHYIQPVLPRVASSLRIPGEMMRILLLLLSAFTLLPSCGAVEVKQEQKLLIVRTEDTSQLRCKQDQSSYLYMYWYQQKAGQGLTLMVLSMNANSEDMEADYKKRWSIKRPTVYNSTLTLKASTTEDSAVYFCAASTPGQGYGNVQYFGAGSHLVVLEKDQEIKGPTITIYRPNKRELQDHNFISLVCVASNFFPEHVKIRWFVNDNEKINLYEPVPQESKDKTYSTSKRLTLTSSEYFNPDSKFRCEAAFLDGTYKTSAEIKGEADCGVSKESYTISINQGKMSYIMVLCKSALYALIVLVLLWRKKIMGSSY